MRDAGSAGGPVLEIPRGLGLGCWEFSDIGDGRPDDEMSVAVIAAARRLGITHFDTADGYGDGQSETVVGRALEPSETLFLASKCRAASKKDTMRIIEQSLRRLRRKWIDLFYIHWPQKGFDLRPMMEGLEELRARGIVHKIGVSNFSVADMESVSEVGRIDAHQICYNLLWRYPEREVIPWCMNHGVELVTYSTIAQGLLSDTIRDPGTFTKGDARAATIYYRPDVWPHVKESVKAMQTAAKECGLSLSTIAIKWVLAQPGVVSALVGARSIAHVERNVRSASASVPGDVMKEISDLSLQAQRHIPDVGNIFLFYP
jgi:myo-inositol catabolism protein IolS